MELYKIYDTSCDICSMLAEIDQEIAENEGWFFSQITLEDLAAKASEIRDYVKAVHVNPSDGLVELPIYLILTPQGQIQADGIVKSVEELTHLINAWKIWASSANAK